MTQDDARPRPPRTAEAAPAVAHFTGKECAAIVAAVAKIAGGAAAPRSGRCFEDEPAAFVALLREAAKRR